MKNRKNEKTYALVYANTLTMRKWMVFVFALFYSSSKLNSNWRGSSPNRL